MCENQIEGGNIRDYGMCNVECEEGRFYCLSIFGQIEGHQVLSPETKTTKYEHLLPLIVKISRDKSIDGLLVILNTMGGDVEAGLAIAEMIAGIDKPTVSLVTGGGHSIGIPLAVSTKYSFITKSATMMLHPVRTNGLVINSPQTFYLLEKMQERITRFVTEHSKISPEKFTAYLMNTDMMANDIGTILDGEQAVEAGLIDEIGNIQKAVRKLFEMKK